MKDEAGQFVKSHLDEAGLKAIAEATGGLYAPLGAQGQGLETHLPAGARAAGQTRPRLAAAEGLHGTIPVAARGFARPAAGEHAHRHAAAQSRGKPKRRRVETRAASARWRNRAAAMLGGAAVPAVPSGAGLDRDRREGLPERRLRRGATRVCRRRATQSEEARSAIQRRHGGLQGGPVPAGGRGVSEIARRANRPPTPSGWPRRRTPITTSATRCIAPARRPSRATRSKPSRPGNRR